MADENEAGQDQSDDGIDIVALMNATGETDPASNEGGGGQQDDQTSAGDTAGNSDEVARLESANQDLKTQLTDLTRLAQAQAANASKSNEAPPADPTTEQMLEEAAGIEVNWDEMSPKDTIKLATKLAGKMTDAAVNKLQAKMAETQQASEFAQSRARSETELTALNTELTAAGDNLAKYLPAMKAIADANPAQAQAGVRNLFIVARDHLSTAAATAEARKNVVSAKPSGGGTEPTTQKNMTLDQAAATAEKEIFG